MQEVREACSRGPAWRPGRRPCRRCRRRPRRSALDHHGDGERGASAGAKAVIQACDRGRLPLAVELGGAGLGRGLDAVLELHAAAGRAVLDDADHELGHRGAMSGAHRRLPDGRAVRLSTRPSRSRVSATTYGVMIWPPLATAGGDHRHLQRRERASSWPKPRIASSGVACVEVRTVAEEARRRPGQVDRERLVEAERLGAGDHRSGAELDRDLGERRVAAAGEHLAEGAAARRAAVVLDRVGRSAAAGTGSRRGRRSRSRARPLSSAVAVVTILNVEPGM